MSNTGDYETANWIRYYDAGGAVHFSRRWWTGAWYGSIVYEVPSRGEKSRKDHTRPGLSRGAIAPETTK